MEIVERFLMKPDSKAWTYDGALKALQKLSKRYAVEAEFYEVLGDFGSGLEELWYLKGNAEGIFSLTYDFEEWARQFSKYFINGTFKIAR